MIPSFIGIYASELTGMDVLGVTIVQLIICYMTIPIRMYARGIIGIRANPLENTGLSSARALLGAAGGLAVKKAFDSSRESKKNAEADRERANLEEDLAKLEQEQKEKEEALAASRLENADISTASADDIKREADKRNGMFREDDIAAELEMDKKNAHPLGEEQNFVKGLEAFISSEEDELKDVALPKEAGLGVEERLKNARLKEALDDKLAESDEELSQLEEMKNAILNDELLTTDEKEEKLRGLDKEIAKTKDTIGRLSNERKDILSVDDNIREANKRKEKLEEEWHAVANDPGMPQREKEQKLNAINDTIKEVSEEIDGYQRQKQKMHLEHEKEAFSKEPAVLRKELESLKAAKPGLDNERDELVRQRDALVLKQAEHATGTKKYDEFDKQIKGLNEKIASRDASIADNLIHQQNIVSALQKQEAGLYDRQAYNLHERVKAQEDYNRAKEEAKFHEKRLDDADRTKSPLLAKGTTERKHVERELDNAKARMEKAKERMASLSNEDRKIAERIQEITPKKSPYTIDELKEAKTAQNIKRAKIQKEIADAQYEMKLNGDNSAEFQAKIAKMQSEVADCNYKSARIDQMIEGLKGVSASKTVGSFEENTKSGAIASEYEKKRAAIMERYANIDNFESPQFAGISRERRAELYRERAMRTQKVFTSRKVSGVLGAAAGATTLLWLGSSGVTTGAIMGGAFGAEIGENIALKRVDELVRKPVDYSDKPRDFRVLSDVRDVTLSGEVRTYDRVRAELRDSLNSTKFENAVTEELINEDLVRAQIRTVFKKHHINSKNYEAKRDVIKAEVNEKVIETVDRAKERIVERCAGKEYVKLSPKVKKQILDEVGVPNKDAFMELTELVYLGSTWQPYYEDYLNDE